MKKHSLLHLVKETQVISHTYGSLVFSLSLRTVHQLVAFVFPINISDKKIHDNVCFTNMKHTSNLSLVRDIKCTKFHSNIILVFNSSFYINKALNIKYIKSMFSNWSSVRDIKMYTIPQEYYFGVQ